MWEGGWTFGISGIKKPTVLMHSRVKFLTLKKKIKLKSAGNPRRNLMPGSSLFYLSL